MEELDDSSTEDDGFISAQLDKTKRWFLSHAQYLNFFTILVLASVSCLAHILNQLTIFNCIHTPFARKKGPC